MEILRSVGLVLALLGFIVWLRWAQGNPGRRLYAVPPLTWLAHVIIFYAAVLFDGLPPAFINAWSTAIRLHGILLALGAGLVLMMDRQK